MPNTATFPLIPSPPATPGGGIGSSSPAPADLTADAFLGRGLPRPLRRNDQGDFFSAAGIELVRACVGQVLGTRCSTDRQQGELAWRPEFGSALHLLRHQNNDAVRAELARVYIGDALRRWEPRVVLRDVTVSRAKSSSGSGEDVLAVRVRYDVVRNNVPGNQVVLAANVEQTVEV